MSLVSLGYDSTDCLTKFSSFSFNLGTTEKGSSSCVASLAASNLGLGNAWLIGDRFVPVDCSLRMA